MSARPPEFTRHGHDEAPNVGPRQWSPAWKRGTLNLPQVLAAVSVVVIMLGTLRLADYAATDSITTREQLVGDDLIASIDRILTVVSTRQASKLAALVGRPCADVRPELTELHTYVRYARAVALVTNGRLYCSSGVGAIDLPLSLYVNSHHHPFEIGLLSQTPYQPGVPVLAMFHATGKGAGLLYVIEGEDIAEILAHGARLDGQNLGITVDGTHFLRDTGIIQAAPNFESVAARRLASKAWPYQITLAATESFIFRARWKYAVIFGVVGILASLLVMAVSLLAFAPRRLLLAAVRRAVANNELYVAYQPIIDIRTRKAVGAEALLRWKHPKWGSISPSVFMGEVESSSVLPLVTDFVLRQSIKEMSRCAEIRAWRVAVNVAPADVRRKDFASQILRLTGEIPPGMMLVLELTERFFLESDPQIAAVFSTLKANGVQFAMDDFGTDHSNLDLLSRYSFDFVKIDRQFIDHINEAGSELVRAVVLLAKHFKLQVVAEGVETEPQHEALREVGVLFGQGYLYQSPLSAKALEEKMLRGLI